MAFESDYTILYDERNKNRLPAPKLPYQLQSKQSIQDFSFQFINIANASFRRKFGEISALCVFANDELVFKSFMDNETKLALYLLPNHNNFDVRCRNLYRSYRNSAMTEGKYETFRFIEDRYLLFIQSMAPHHTHVHQSSTKYLIFLIRNPQNILNRIKQYRLLDLTETIVTELCFRLKAQSENIETCTQSVSCATALIQIAQQVFSGGALRLNEMEFITAISVRCGIHRNTAQSIFQEICNTFPHKMDAERRITFTNFVDYFSANMSVNKVVSNTWDAIKCVFGVLPLRDKHDASVISTKHKLSELQHMMDLLDELLIFEYAMDGDHYNIQSAIRENDATFWKIYGYAKYMAEHGVNAIVDPIDIHCDLYRDLYRDVDVVIVCPHCISGFVMNKMVNGFQSESNILCDLYPYNASVLIAGYVKSGDIPRSIQRIICRHFLQFFADDEDDCACDGISISLSPDTQVTPSDDEDEIIYDFSSSAEDDDCDTISELSDIRNVDEKGSLEDTNRCNLVAETETARTELFDTRDDDDEADIIYQSSSTENQDDDAISQLSDTQHDRTQQDIQNENCDGRATIQLTDTQKLQYLYYPIEDTENVIENRMLRYDVDVIKNGQSCKLESEESEIEELRRKNIELCAEIKLLKESESNRHHLSISVDDIDTLLEEIHDDNNVDEPSITDLEDSHDDNPQPTKISEISSNELQNEIKILIVDSLQSLTDELLRKQSEFEMATHMAQGSNTQSMINELQNEIEILKREKEILQNENNLLKDECKETKTELMNLKSKYNELKSNIRPLDTRRYTEWSEEEVILWIASLENGRFKKYEATLKITFREQEFVGQWLDDVQKSDVHDWGIKHFGDKTKLFQCIDAIRNKKRVSLEGNTSHI